MSILEAFLCLWMAFGAAAWWLDRKKGAAGKAQNAPECPCPLCRARLAGRSPSPLPMPVQMAVLVGIEAVRTGRAPAAVWLTDVVGQDGVGKLAVVVVDGGIWDRVAQPAIAAHLGRKS